MYPFLLDGAAHRAQASIISTSKSSIQIPPPNSEALPCTGAVRHHPHGRHSTNRRCAHMSREPEGGSSLLQTECGVKELR